MIFLDVIFYIFIFAIIIQLGFYLIIFRKLAFLNPQKKRSYKKAVSVIICAKNEAKNLQKFFPSIINQSYPDFEIILINDVSQDHTLKIMEAFASKHDNIKVVNVRNNETFWGNKKYALTLGIKASKNNILLFTDADCKPVSKYWIRDMCSHFVFKKTIVLGYGTYSKTKNSLLNKLIRFETLITAVQYFSFAKIGLPYMGVGRNLAYAKSEFYSVNGFIDHLNILSGDDDLFVNQVATQSNTAICFLKTSFTESIPEKSLKNWYKQKRRHVSTAKKYKLIHKFLLALLYISQLLFWVLSITLLVTLFKWPIVLILFILRLSVQNIVIKAATDKLGERDILKALPFLEIILIIIQLTIFINNIISKPNHWK